MSLGRLGAMGCGLLVAGTLAAHADAIDGHWCYPDGRRFSIQGPAIVTPAGTQLDGDYARHFFRYVVPPADPDAGQTVFMALVNENTVHLRIGAAPSYASDADTQVWHRCGPPTS
ncbi:MAG TPA: hypothetical protein VFL55_01610 [Acetobacteraceae bacterium]|nr:hypothetical protein [Acetobacteraceae bacterium]